MSGEASIEMLSLLKELSVYRAMDEDYKAGAKGRLEEEAYEEREQRRQEIKQEMQNLAAESNNAPHKDLQVLLAGQPSCNEWNQPNSALDSSL